MDISNQYGSFGMDHFLKSNIQIRNRNVGKLIDSARAHEALETAHSDTQKRDQIIL